MWIVTLGGAQKKQTSTISESGLQQPQYHYSEACVKTHTANVVLNLSLFSRYSVLQFDSGFEQIKSFGELAFTPYAAANIERKNETAKEIWRIICFLKKKD